MNEGDFAIAWTSASRRALTRLPEKVATAVVEFPYGSLAASPHRVGKPLKLALEGLHSARRGDFRVIYRIDEERRLVTVVAIEHRADAYRPRSLPAAGKGLIDYNGAHALHGDREIPPRARAGLPAGGRTRPDAARRPAASTSGGTPMSWPGGARLHRQSHEHHR